MKLTPGTRLGFYEVVAQIGAGGMGEVYQAHNTKFGRNVAIKVLPASFVNDPERLSRFQREARTLAALNHPNIAATFGLEEDRGRNYLAMELDLGDTLAQRFKAGPLPVDEAPRPQRNTVPGADARAALFFLPLPYPLAFSGLSTAKCGLLAAVRKYISSCLDRD